MTLPLRIIRRSPAPQAILDARLHPVLRRAYAARGVSDAIALDHSLERMLPLGTLDGIHAAAELLIAHRNGRILVVGDFDADGATSTALLLRALRAWQFASVDFLVPNRFTYGYGLTPGIVALAAQRSPSLIVTVDNGISSIEGVAAARALGIEVLVTDHHLPGAELPAANVLLNPNLPGSGFASRALAGVGVAFYLAAALRRELVTRGLIARDAPGASTLLDLVALGTVADVVPLDANNRILVSQGLARIRAARCAPGILALLSIAGRELGSLSAADLGFAIAPRLNAAGRIDDMSIGIQCLLADDPAEARSLAARLDTLNTQRREIEAQMQEEALAAVRRLRDPQAAESRHGVCLYDPGWHQGVIGLVASRVKDALRRPVIAFADAGDGTLRGSARSIPGVHVRDVLEAIATRTPGLLARFGGHAMAAGLTLDLDRLDAFARDFDREVRVSVEAARLIDGIETDGELELAEIALDTALALRSGGPWGQAFPEPCFDGLFRVRNVRVINEKHLKMWLEVPRSGRSFDAIAFNALESRSFVEAPDAHARFVYRLGVNSWNGESRLQLVIDHVLPP